MQHTEFCPSVVVDAITWFSVCKSGRQHQWSSGRIHRCHRCDPGSIPGWCTFSKKDFSIHSINQFKNSVRVGACMYVCVCAVVCVGVCERMCLGGSWENKTKKNKTTQYNTRTKTKWGWQNPATCARVVPKPFQIWPCDIQCHNCEHVAWFRRWHINNWKKKLWVENQRRNDICGHQGPWISSSRSTSPYACLTFIKRLIH